MLTDYGLNISLVPVGGWRYEQPWKHGIQRIPATGTALDPDDLIRLVYDFRSTHNILIGDIEFDIAEFIKRVSGANNRFPNRTYEPKIDVNHKPLINRIREWIDATASRKPKPIAQHDAAERANICLLCPQNVKWRTKCDPCNEEVDERGQNLRRLAIFKPGDCLGACRIYSIHLPSAIFLDRDILPLANDEAPSHCWLRAEPTSRKD